MAYLKERKKEVDIDFPLDDIWQALPKAADEFDWDIEEKDEAAHTLTVKTSSTLTSYGSTLRVELKPLSEKTTRMTIYGETPVTTITSTLQFGQTYDVVDDFVLALADVMNR
ncbi:MAG: hypothetical protein ACFCUE_04805 [Candidatus Bathyarchaeia archaeon]|jgi:hypothetical protein